MNGKDIMDAWQRYYESENVQRAMKELGKDRIMAENWLRVGFLAGLDACESSWRDGMAELVEDTEAKILRRGK